ncbi:copper oxidase [Nonomuraea mesophila]|uniref:Copper oxidase n=1 Tax=Nonomuraea mesophila TaxID=2530382 RepID=A0A4R5EJ21_9ACTN|nr:multicopper oxidase domain-containing protein [Nonomuraea mesophila]TDE34404.1 copper oxidase [Nonomuraea mesophila]
MKRRTLLKAGLIAVPATAAATLGGAGWWWAGADLDTAGKIRFVNRLTIPPLAPSQRDPEGRRVFDLRASPGEHRFRAGRPTPTWGINGPYLAPTLRAARGETVVIRFRNDLPETTTLHWHGMHLPARMDGGPHQPVEPGTTWSPTWTVNQPAATLWYHPHPHGRTAVHVYRGLSGLFILDEPGARGLPSQYGVDDIPVIVRDLNLTEHNELDERDREQGGVGIVGDLVTVNGTPAPYLPVTTQRVRLRLLNGSNSRIYRFGFGSGRTFTVVGTDGGLLAAPYETGRVQLSPGERAEIVVALRPGERDALRSFPPETGLNPWDRRWTGGDDTLDVLELRAARRLAPSPPLPARLAEAPRLVTDPATPPVRRFELSGYTINGRAMDMKRIDFAVAQGSTEVWEVTAIDDAPHNFHVHDVQFQLVSVGGAPPPPELRGWKDTVHTPPNVPVRIALRFRGEPDPATPYMFHCHILNHEDQGLMGQYVVTAPGRSAGRSPVRSAPTHHQH